MVYKHAVVAAFMLSVVKLLLKGEVGVYALNSHGNYIFDDGKSWYCVFEFLWEPCFYLRCIAQGECYRVLFNKVLCNHIATVYTKKNFMVLCNES